ncbi:unnamed protein product [Phyllotreta striolata]|uniref:Uncharacterized protein n=1 Tax=Phyllotreta striolata TaxID=444603 RepID=A0A9N9TIR2_PHYSR|nr:unnamed protein product [Phyllotreta striolata]
MPTLAPAITSSSFARTLHHRDAFSKTLLVLLLLTCLSPAAAQRSAPPASPSKLRCYRKGAVSMDAAQCLDIGKETLLRNGTAVDAMIAVLICNGVVNMQSMSLGGGFFMLVYKKSEHKVYSLNARETAPAKAKNSLYKIYPNSTSDGILSVAVPGELKGYYAAHQKFGKLPWEALVAPTIELCERGYIMTKHQYKSVKLREGLVERDPNFKQWFYDEDCQLKLPGSRIVPTKLCETLKAVAKNGPNDFYTGTLSKSLLKDIKDSGGIITEQDLNNYQIEWSEPYKVKLTNGDTLYTAPPPASGPILALILNVLDKLHFTPEHLEGTNNTIATLHRIIEVFKYAYARRTELGDPKFVDMRHVLEDLSSNEYAESIGRRIEDGRTYAEPLHYGGRFYDGDDTHGTSHLNVMAPNGDVASATSSVNIYFGAGMTSKSTGVVLNSHMDDFSYPWMKNYFGLPGSPSNHMLPGKRPLSSMAPAVVLDENCNVKLVIGAAGGTQITSAVALAIMRVLWFDNNIKEAIDAPRIHHQLVPMKVFYENGIGREVIDGLEAIGHTMEKGTKSNICGLYSDQYYIYGNADYRKGGGVRGFD